MAFENERFTVAQDWELPIEGFMIVSPKRHVERLDEFSRDERIEMLDIVNRTIKILRENDVCEKFDVIFEERANRHLRVWIMPRHEWMMEICEGIIDNVEVVCDYAKKNFRNDEVYERISEVNEMVREGFEKREKMK